MQRGRRAQPVTDARSRAGLAILCCAPLAFVLSACGGGSASPPRPAGDASVGQGLAIARAIVDKHAGTLEFDTELGGGTTFTIRLPIAGAHATKRTAA